MDHGIYICAERGKIMHTKRLMIAATKSGSGKTLLTCALIRALMAGGQRVMTYKCGPDYIDPLFHQMVSGIPSGNLDTFFTGGEDIGRMLARAAGQADVILMEGVMGLFDGLGGVREEGSSYHLAKVTKTPIALVADVRGMSRSAVAVLAGFRAYDREGLIRGVILNRATRSLCETLKPLIEEELGLPVLGYFPERREFCIESRHLGLALPREREGILRMIGEASESLCETVSVEKLLALAEGEELPEAPGEDGAKRGWFPSPAGLSSAPVIAVARDEAFCFYYEENLRLLRECGARLRFFSPLRDSGLPEGCCGILLGGGYPELYAGELCANAAMRLAVKEAADKGMPLVAECGGFLYLHEKLTDGEGNEYDMAGVLPGGCASRGKAVRFGYVELRERQSGFLPEGERIRGHEFHYYDCEDNGDDCIARKPVTGKEYPCVWQRENCWMGFPHLYYPSNPAFARRFVEMAEEYGRQNSVFV